MKGALKEKSYAFAIRIVKLSLHLSKEKKEFRLSDQILRSGTAIGALIREAEYGESKRDFVHKMSIALKEANETEYWLCLLKDTAFIDERLFDSFVFDVKELIKMLISTIKTAKKVNNEQVKQVTEDNEQ